MRVEKDKRKKAGEINVALGEKMEVHKRAGTDYQYKEGQLGAIQLTN